MGMSWTFDRTNIYVKCRTEEIADIVLQYLSRNQQWNKYTWKHATAIALVISCGNLVSNNKTQRRYPGK